MAFIQYEEHDQVGLLTIDRPQALNALNTELLKELEVIRASMKPVEDELHQVETGIRAMEGAVLKPTGHEASLKAVAHYGDWIEGTLSGLDEL